MTVSRVQMPTHRGHVFFKFSADQLLAFNWSKAQVYVFHSHGSPLKLSLDLRTSLLFKVCGLRQFRVHERGLCFQLRLNVYTTCISPLCFTQETVPVPHDRLYPSTSQHSIMAADSNINWKNKNNVFFDWLWNSWYYWTVRQQRYAR